jgi:hypothetical protein
VLLEARKPPLLPRIAVLLPLTVSLVLYSHFGLRLLIRMQAVKSGRVTKRAPKTPSKLKRVDSDDEDDEMMDVTAAVKEEEV